MSSLFAFLILLSLIGLVWGLIAPRHINKVMPIRHELSRKYISIGFMALVLVSFVLSSVTTPSQKMINVEQTSLTTSDKSSNTTPKPKAQTPVVITEQQTQVQALPYATQDQNDSSLAKGQTKVAQAGQNGTETLTYKVTYTNGKQTSEALVSTIVTTQPVGQVVDIGTYVAPAPIAPPAPTQTSSCSPTSDEGTCYEPGEYCRNLDHGMTGVAGDGKSIMCEDNDGWRWEPS